MTSTSTGPSINVTPLIDVLLVLLIIFLVLLPIMSRFEPVTLPQNNADVISEQVPTVVKLNGDLTISIDDGPAVSTADLPSIRAHHMPKTVFVDAESTVPWTEVTSIVDRIRGLAPSPEAVQVAVRIHDAE